MKIHDLAEQGDIAGVAAELAAGVDVDCLKDVGYGPGQTPLHCAAVIPDISLDMLRFLVGQGAKITSEVVRAAAWAGSLATLDYLFECGADIACVEPGGNDILTVAACGRSYTDDPTLVPVLEWLIAHGARLNEMDWNGWSALRTVADNGRFNAVRSLLEHGADVQQLYWTDLMYAIVLGTIEEVQTLLEKGSALDARDFRARTPFLLSLQTGDIWKASLLLRTGANREEKGHCKRTPMQIAVESRKPVVLKWLIEQGFDVNDTDQFGGTALLSAIEREEAECVRILLDAGADPTKGPDYSRPIKAVSTIEILQRMLAVGEDLSDVSDDMRRVLNKVTQDELSVTPKEYKRGKHPRFGRTNPERMNVPFWRAMVHSECNAYTAKLRCGETNLYGGLPVWCYDRFGRSVTWMPDGRIIEVAGEHEDSYDADFCIYNDVVVFDGKGDFEIYGYPEEVFPPTDFHSATLVGNSIYLIGSLGYHNQRKPGETQVLRLDCTTFRIERVVCNGENPGWISRHKAVYEPEANRIVVNDGKVWDGSNLVANWVRYALDLKTHVWERLVL